MVLVPQAGALTSSVTFLLSKPCDACSCSSYVSLPPPAFACTESALSGSLPPLAVLKWALLQESVVDSSSILNTSCPHWALHSWLLESSLVWSWDQLRWYRVSCRGLGMQLVTVTVVFYHQETGELQSCSSSKEEGELQHCGCSKWPGAEPAWMILIPCNSDGGNLGLVLCTLLADCGSLDAMWAALKPQRAGLGCAM